MLLKNFVAGLDSEVQNLIWSAHARVITFFITMPFSLNKKKCAGSIFFCLGLNFLFYNLFSFSETKSVGCANLKAPDQKMIFYKLLNFKIFEFPAKSRD